MEQLVGWSAENWFSLVQSAGIVGGLWFTCRSFRQSARDHQAANRLALAQHHRELWSAPQQSPELGRVFDTEVDLIQKPVSLAEREFLIEVIYHFQTCWELSRSSGLVSRSALKLDAKEFFALPLPLSVWKENRATRDPSFVAFIDSCLERD